MAHHALLDRFVNRLLGVTEPTLSECFLAGQSRTNNGWSVDTCHFRFFTTPEKTTAWIRGSREPHNENPYAAKAEGKL